MFCATCLHLHVGQSHVGVLQRRAQRARQAYSTEELFTSSLPLEPANMPSSVSSINCPLALSSFSSLIGAVTIDLRHAGELLQRRSRNVFVQRRADLVHGRLLLNRSRISAPPLKSIP